LIYRASSRKAKATQRNFAFKKQKQPDVVAQAFNTSTKKKKTKNKKNKKIKNNNTQKEKNLKK
jgi:hypothetical protein